ncbi:metallophosphoesterase [Planococcus sp. CAU13]|uniref:metallophosphoesterase n=1 Tax=Planococcus sp. CAU13 TaxID=1541197 RepID=UPI00052FF5EB|nr:metallophosphoesterase [Planococcus sp. CAU13]
MKYFFGTGFAATAALLLFMYRNAGNIKEKNHVIRLDTATGFKPFRILFIADIHRKKLPEALVSRPVDAVIIGGDLTERGVPLRRTADNLRILTSAAPVYYIWGNNDREVGERNLRKLMKHFGVHVLDNQAMELLGQPNLKVVGIDYFSRGEAKIEKAFSTVGEDDTVLFASHTPAIFKYLRKDGKADFMMAGHTHGGQIRLGRFGLYDKGSMKRTDAGYELVTNGYGTTSLPLRLGAEAEYHVIDVYPNEKLQ